MIRSNPLSLDESLLQSFRYLPRIATDLIFSVRSARESNFASSLLTALKISSLLSICSTFTFFPFEEKAGLTSLSIWSGFCLTNLPDISQMLEEHLNVLVRSNCSCSPKYLENSLIIEMSEPAKRLMDCQSSPTANNLVFCVFNSALRMRALSWLVSWNSSTIINW